MTTTLLCPPKDVVGFGCPNPATQAYFQQVMAFCTKAFITTWEPSSANVPASIATLAQCLQWAQAASPNWWASAIIDLTCLWFGPDKRPLANGTSNFQAFVEACAKANVYNMLTHAYLCDEPDANGYSAGDFELVCNSIHNVAPWMKCCTTFNNFGNAQAYMGDLQGAGFDAYPGMGGAELDPMEALFTRSDQFGILVAGVGLGQGVEAIDPAPYLAHMQALPWVKMLMLFTLFDGWANNPANLGAFSAGRGQACIDVGMANIQYALEALARCGPDWSFTQMP